MLADPDFPWTYHKDMQADPDLSLLTTPQQPKSVQNSESPEYTT